MIRACRDPLPRLTISNHSSVTPWTLNGRFLKRSTLLLRVILFFFLSGHFQNSCLNDFSTCPQGMSFAFWLQFIDGAYVMCVTKANNTVLSVQVNDNGKLLIQLHAGSILWKIKWDCFPVGWFHLTVTWDNTSKLNVSVASVLNATTTLL